MQCSNCQFQNMPGVQTCGRCGASLQLASSAIDVHPPRASLAAKRWRRWLPSARWQRWFTFSGWRQQLSTWWAYSRRVVSDILAYIRAIQWPSGMPRLGLVMRTIVPGWAHWYSGRFVRARWIFGCYIGLLLLALSLALVRAAYPVIQLVIVFHAASVADALPAKERFSWQRLFYFALAWLVLSNFVYVYYPVVRLMGW